MSDRPSNEHERERRPQAGSETRISSTPYAERIKRAKRGGLGGNKMIFALGIIALLLVAGIAAVFVKKMLEGRSKSGPPPTTMSNISLSTIPDSAAIYRADALLGYTPITFAATEGESLRVRHSCCPDTIIALMPSQAGSAVVRLRTVVEINSNPTGAGVTVNGTATGRQTPYRFPVFPTDTIQVALDMAGKPTLNSGPVILSQLANTQVSGFDFSHLGNGISQITGEFVETPQQMVSVNSTPAGATVTNATTGEVLGETPLRRDFGNESVLLKISKAGFEDWQLKLPATGTRKDNYTQYLFRRVELIVTDEKDQQKPINWRVKDLTYGGRVYSYTEKTPALLRLPGIDCSMTIGAEGYQDSEVSISATQSQASAVLRTVEKKQQEQKKEVLIPSGSSEVKVIVVDNDKSPIAGATVTAERKEGNKITLTLGTTDREGVVKAMLEPGKYKFLATHPEYKSKDETEKVDAGRPFVLTLKTKRK